MIRIGAITLNPGENEITTTQSDDTYIYAVTSESFFPGTIVKIRKQDLVRVKSLTLSAGENYLDTSISDPLNLYLGTATVPGQIIKVNKNDLTHVGKMELPAGMKSLTMQDDDFYLYVCTFTAPARVLKILKSTMTVTGVSQTISYTSTTFTNVDGVEFNWLLSSVADDDFIYVCTTNSPGTVAKIDKLSLRLDGQYQLAAGENVIQTSQQYGDYLYVGTNDYPGKLIQIRKSDMSRVASLTLDTGENLIQTSQIDADGAFVYAITNGLHSPAVIVKVRTSDMSREGALTLEADEVKPFTSQSDAKHIYIGLRTKPGKVVKINKSPDVDCATGPFSDWTACSKTCDNGQRSHSREIVLQPTLGGAACPVISESEACSTFNCPVDCELEVWGPWTACDPTTGALTKIRVIAVAPAFGGIACPPTKQTQPCIVNCLLDDWPAWSECNLVSGYKVRTRSIIYNARNGGVPCKSLAEHQPCDVNCTVSEWSDWSLCDRVSGVMQRSRSITLMNKNRGRTCPVLTDYTDCTVHCLAGPWSHYETCGADGTPGYTFRTRGVVLHSVNGGLPCTLKEVARCAAPCEVSNWGTQSNKQLQAPAKRGTWDAAAEQREAYYNGNDASFNLVTDGECENDCKADGGCKAYGFVDGKCEKYDGTTMSTLAWTICDPNSGQRERFRVIVRQPGNDGQKCPSLAELSDCQVDCGMTQWSSWDACDSTIAQQYRVRKILYQPKNNGAICGALTEARSCSVDCKLTEWSDFDDCSRDCGGGDQMRVRAIVQEPVNGGEPCGTLEDTRTCNEQDCNANDCIVSDWSCVSGSSAGGDCDEWTTCTKSCGGGEKTKTRSIVQAAALGGAACPDLRVTQACNTGLCVIDCEFSSFSDWGACNPVSGEQVRTLTVFKQPANGGASCPPTSETQKCAVDCAISAWECADGTEREPAGCDPEVEGSCTVNCEEWASCDSNGQRVRQRQIVHPSRNSGAPCPSLREYQECGSNTCAAVSTEWSVWSDCVEVGIRAGTRERTRQFLPGIEVNSVNQACVLRMEEVCVLNCKVSEWAPWDPCNKATGQRTRARDILVDQMNGGADCPPIVEMQTCIVDCELDEFSNYGECDKNTGEQKRYRSVLVMPMNGGVACDVTEQSKTCAVDCELSPWSEFSVCGQGDVWKEKTRDVVFGQRNGGAPCGVLKETAECNSSLQCKSTQWTDWSDCQNTGEDAGTQYRTREEIPDIVNGEDQNEGKPCTLQQTQDCPVSCEVSDWGEWGIYSNGIWTPDGCNVQLNQALREKTVMVHPMNGGAPCPELNQTQTCVQDCVMGEWTIWTVCDSATGRKARSRQVVMAARNGGKSCPSLQDQQACRVDCVLHAWGTWTTCHQILGFTTRTRAVKFAKRNGGSNCGLLEETADCDVNCTATQWSDWTECAKVDAAGITAGTARRNREELIQSQNNGLDNCHTSDVVSCVVDCETTGWSNPGPCINLQRKSTRSVTFFPLNQGTACPALEKTLECETDQFGKGDVSSIAEYISTHKVSANLTYAHTVEMTLQLEQFPGILDAQNGNKYFPMLSTDNIRDAIARFLANELVGVRTKDIIVALVPSKFDTEVEAECANQPPPAPQVTNQYGYQQEVVQQVEYCRNYAYSLQFTVRNLEVAVDSWNKLLFSVSQNSFLSAMKREFDQTWQMVYQGQIAPNGFIDLKLGFYVGDECGHTFKCRPSLDSDLCVVGMSRAACNENGGAAKVAASMTQLLHNDAGQEYSRALETEFRLVGYQIATIETEVQFMLMSVLTNELNMPPGTVGVVVKQFALRKELIGNAQEEAVYVSLQVRTTDQQAADLAFKFQILSMEPTEFLSKLQAELQERRVLPDTHECKAFNCMTLSNPKKGITTTRISTESVHAEFQGDGDGDGDGDGEGDYYLSGGNSNMMMMAMVVMVVLAVVGIVVMVIRYRKQKRQKDAFFEKLDQDDNDNALDDEEFDE